MLRSRCSSTAHTHSFFHDQSRQTAIAKTDNNDYHLRQRAMSPTSTAQRIVQPLKARASAS